MKTFLTAFTTLLFLHSTASAAELDTQSAVISWTGSKITGDKHSGGLAPKSSSFVLADGVITSGEIVFEMGSMTVGDLEGEWETKFLGHMKSPDFFDVASFPTATLKLKSFKKGQMTGDLTIKGVTRPIAFPAEVKDGKYVGKASFNRTEFGITYGSGSFFEDLGDKMINDTVDVEFSFAVKGD